MESEGGQRDMQRLRAFERMLGQIEASNWKSALQKGCRIYNVKSFNVEKLSPDKVRQLYKRIHERFYICQRSKNGVWIENELRLFVWILMLVSEIANTSPQLYSDEDWKPIAAVFQGKSIQTLKFQYKSITNKKVTSWNQEQDELLKEMIRQRNEVNPNWNQISRDLFNISREKYFKTSKQCREHWNNYLNPGVLKSQWDRRQDYVLMKHVVEKGKQWSAISKLLQAKRTEHMVKNRFKSLVLTYSKDFNISKKHSESTTVLQKILKRIKSEFQEFQQSDQESILPEEEEKLEEIPTQPNAKKSAFQLVPVPSTHQSTTVGIGSPAVFSPCTFGFQFPQGIFSHFVVQMPVIGVETNLFQPTFYQMANQSNQQK